MVEGASESTRRFRRKNFVVIPRPSAHSTPVMAGLVPAIHVFTLLQKRKTWMPGTRPGMTNEEAKSGLAEVAACIAASPQLV
jgi:hypothetical protein